MVYAQIREAIVQAAPHRLSEVASALWQAFGANGLSEDEAGELSALLDARRDVARAAPPKPVMAVAVARVTACAVERARVGSRARSAESLMRRRRWAAAGFLPPALACAFTQGQIAALAVVAQEATEHGRCTLPLSAIAGRAGVGESTAKRALRQARALGLIAVEERRLARDRNDTNVVRIASREWAAWLRLRMPRAGGTPRRGGGVQAESPTVNRKLSGDSVIESGFVSGAYFFAFGSSSTSFSLPLV